MPQKIIQTQTLQQTQTLSPQQVLQARLLEMPLAQLEQRVENEMMENGALEESCGSASTTASATAETEDNNFDSFGSSADTASDNETDENYDVDDSAERYADLESLYGTAPGEQLKQALADYSSADEVPPYLLNQSNISADSNTTLPERPAYAPTFYEALTEQLAEMDLSEKLRPAAEYIIGSLDPDGILRKPLRSLADELEVYHATPIDMSVLEQALEILQARLEPAGIGARNLQECLLIQIARRKNISPNDRALQRQTIQDLFDEFTHNRWDKISRRLHLTSEQTQHLQNQLRKLNPRPGAALGADAENDHGMNAITPDFIVTTPAGGSPEVMLCQGEIPGLSISPAFARIAENAQPGNKLSRAEKEAVIYARQKIEKAQAFIEAIRQRRQTLLSTMQAIVDLQEDFFISGDEATLHPMILKDVANRTGLDISTTSRATASKYVQTDFGTYPLKWFFSDAYITPEGEEIATRKIHAALRELIENENKETPLSDDALATSLAQKGYPIARRTVAKYREQLGIPVARLRRQ